MTHLLLGWALFAATLCVLLGVLLAIGLRWWVGAPPKGGATAGGSASVSVSIGTHP